MTKDEKQVIYRLLKAADDAGWTFSSPNFPLVEPVFADDAQVRPAAPAAREPEPAPSAGLSGGTVSAESPSSEGKLSSLYEKVAACTRCGLSRTRTNTVPGMGVENPLVMVVGEGPGESEDMTGLPFVGAAGQLLDKMLAAISLSRAKNCYIANIVKCRPPENRNPLPDEAAACRSFLEAQIAILKPKSILCAGSVAVKNLLQTGDGVTRLHGKILEYRGIPVLATYHPSALLHDPSKKRIAWEDLKIFRAKLLEIEPGYNS
ncbi:MAG: uracil-DNA glycosylase [Treponema sp.]|nr:uracil-DNA glycosylase [Treponema sp.]